MDESLGIVVSPNFNVEKNPKCYVLDVDALLRIGTPLTIPVDEMAFKLPCDSHNMEITLRKNMARRLERPLHFGQCISWKDSDCMENRKHEKTIIRFDRQLELFPVRVSGGKFQLLIDGIVNPNHPTHLFTEYIRAIRIPDEKRRDVWPNIYYKVWLSFICNDKGALNIEFGDFHAVAPVERQLDVSGAPWNKDLSKFTISMTYSDSEDDDGYGGIGYMVANKKPGNDKPLIELSSRDATLTGSDRMIMWEFPHLKTVLPIRYGNMQIGRLYSIDCCWNSFENMYMVTRVSPSRKNENLKTSDTGKLRCSVKAISIPGVFENPEFGILDDPKSLLSLLPFTKYAENAIPVTIEDNFPSRGGQFRFSISEIHGEKREKFEKIVEQADFHVEDQFGIVIDGGHVVCAAYAANVFKFGERSVPPKPGSRIIFTAEYRPALRWFEVTDWRLEASLAGLPVVDRIVNANKRDMRQSVFYVMGKIPVHNTLTKTLMTKEFGLVDDNLELVKFAENNAHSKVYHVWVTLAGNEDPVKCRTPFQVVAIGDIPPDDRVINDEMLSPSDVSLHSAFRSIITVSVASSRTSSVSNDEDIDTTQDDSVAPDFEVTLDDCVSVTSQASDRTLRPPSSAAFGAFEDFAQSRGASLLYDAELHPTSMMTVDGNIDPSRHLRDARARVVHKYDGPVYMPPGSTHTFNVVETLSRLKYSFHHSPCCGLQCASNCPWLLELAGLVVTKTGFWEDAEEFYPNVASVLLTSLSNLG